MSFRANVLRVMIASPGDVARERAIVTDAIHRWNDANASSRRLVLLPVKWETHSTPQLGGHPQTIINRQLLDEADIVIGIFGTRIGTPTEEYISGTVEEIKKHVAAGKTAKIYFSDVPVAPSSVDAQQYALVQSFRDECRTTGLYATFESLDQFRVVFSHHLDLELNQPRYRWLALPEDDSEGSHNLSEDALRLLHAAASDDGVIIFQEGLDSCGLRAGVEEFLADGSPRSRARWKSALDELASGDLLEHMSEGVYRVASEGYDVADGNGRGEQKAPDSFSAFDEQQTQHIRALIQPLSCRERDLLRFLLLQGGSARQDVVFRAAANRSGLDMMDLPRQLIQNGLLTRTEDPLLGQFTLAVKDLIVPSLKSVLFPRNDDDAPFFNNV